MRQKYVKQLRAIREKLLLLLMSQRLYKKKHVFDIRELEGQNAESIVKRIRTTLSSEFGFEVDYLSNCIYK